jgi:type II secretory pathway pseudopilin PulG
MRRRTGFRSAIGFTLVELLVVIGIIVLLIGILLPVVRGIKQSAYAASSGQQIARLTSAIESYYSDHRAYPGPFSNDQIITGGSGTGAAFPTPIGGERVTMSENAVLGLIGGLKLTNAGIEYDPERIANRLGPMSLNAVAPKGGHTYLEVSAAELSLASIPKNTKPYQSETGGPVATDSQVPEFLDAFPDSLPVLVYRARKGAPGVISNNNSPSALQYDVQQNYGYLNPGGGKTGIGGNGPHGLTEVGQPYLITDGTKVQRPEAPWGNAGGVKAYTAWTYFANPQLTPTTPPPTLATGTPRQKDSYILISPGKDRVYGTRDDITNFGGVQ